MFYFHSKEAKSHYDHQLFKDVPHFTEKVEEEITYKHIKSAENEAVNVLL